MPINAPSVPDERSALVAFVAQQQYAFKAVVYGLTDAQAGIRSTASELTVGTLVKHVTATQDAWLTTARTAPEKYVDPRSMEQKFADWSEAFSWRQTDTIEAAMAAFDDVCARVLDAIRTLDLDTAVPVPDDPWYGPDQEPWSVRWVWFHLIEELARHAGHADIIREGVDGATMYSLVAGLEGWPETEWIKPWTPAPEPAQ